MEIQSLKLIVTEADANLLLAEFVPADLEVKNLHVRFTPEGVQVTGETQALLFKVSFSTLWEMAVLDEKVMLRLSSMKVAGIPAGKLRGVLMKVLRDAVAGKPGITVGDERIEVDVNAILQAREVPLRMRLTTIHCDAGVVVVSA
jgi:hypothetical protein